MTATRVPALDGLRGVAIAAVLLSHVLPGPLAALGPVGVLLFFVLSGFLITTLLVSEFQRRGWIDYRQFMVRRALRLLPAMVTVLGGYLLVVALAPGLSTEPADAVRAASLAVLFLVDLTAGLGVTVPVELSPHWSLGVEEHFYLVWPLVVAVGLRGGARRLGGLIRAILIGAVVLGPVAPLVLGETRVEPYFLPTSWAYALVAGALVSIGFSHPRPGGLLAHVLIWARTPLAVPTAIAALAPFVLAAGYFAGPDRALLIAPFEAGALSLLLCAVLVRPGSSWVHRLLSVAPLRELGAISYGLYLLNLPAILLAVQWWGDNPWNRAMGGVAAVALAWAMHRWVEQPALRLKDRIGLPRADVRPPHRDRTVDPVVTQLS